MPENNQEIAVNKGFSKIYEHYESLNNESIIDQTMRQQVYAHIERFLKSNHSILELNSGSGIDAVYFAKKGYAVVATDIADGSQNYIESKIEKLKLHNLSFKKSSFLNLDELKKQHFDYVFSNFGGLNCTNELEKVVESLNLILKKKAIITFVIMGKYYPWDWIYIFKGNFKRAFIRFKKNNALANVEGEAVKTYYHSPKKIRSLFKKDFDYLKAESLGLFYPSVNHTSVTKHTNLVKKLISFEKAMNQKKCVPAGIGDYYIITFKKK